jgi:predicted MFS family arabinose efflux permease
MVSTVAWIIAGSALAVLLLALAAWALISRRRRRDVPLSVAFCARHPEHAMCAA